MCCTTWNDLWVSSPSWLFFYCILPLTLAIVCWIIRDKTIYFLMRIDRENFTFLVLLLVTVVFQPEWCFINLIVYWVSFYQLNKEQSIAINNSWSYSSELIKIKASCWCSLPKAIAGYSFLDISNNWVFFGKFVFCSFILCTFWLSIVSFQSPC